MVIVKYELRQIRSLVVSWSIALPLLLFLLLPNFISIVIGADGSVKTDVVASISDNAFLQAVDMSAEFLSQPIGMYGFLTGWLFGIACAVISTQIGLSVHTKEYIQKAADFLMTKPHSRAKIYLAKLMAVSIATLAISISYFIASYIALSVFLSDGFDFALFALLGGSVILIGVLYMALGVFMGVIAQRINKTLLAAVTVVFATLAIGQFAVAANLDLLIFLSPQKYFAGSFVASIGRYDMRYVVWLVFLVIAFLSAGYIIFRKKDIITT
ncbi:MAG: ABC transporter permease [Oscillospiraceae bacterium]|nr:ABC transporter permease [Oscillospiraceae bacterium]